MREKFTVEGMSCSACSTAVEKAVKRLDGIKSADVNLLAKSMVCVFDEKTVTVQDIENAVKKAGFSAYVLQKREETPKDNIKVRLILSIVFLVILMYISMGHMLHFPFTHYFMKTENATAFVFTQFLLTLPILYLNRKFYIQGFKALKNKSPNMDSLVAVGSLAAVVYGIFAIYMIGAAAGRGDTETVRKYMSNVYFESAATILTLVTVGKYIEERAKNKTNSAVKRLMDMSPKQAVRLENGKETVIPASQIKKGDILVIRPGEQIPVDGIVTDGESSVNEAALTGESMPVNKKTGDNLMSASININGSMHMRAEKVGEETTFSKIIRLVEEASASKAPIARLADKVSGIFVPVVMSLAVITFVTWLILGKSAEFALGCGISVLVISCPCALGLATPVAIMVAMGKSASNGILIKSASALETLCNVKTVVFDKTGTLTEGKPSVTDIVPINISEEELVVTAASAEALSEHPLAGAVCEYAEGKKLKKADNFTALFGKGISAEIGEKNVLAGNAEFMTEKNVDISGYEEKAKQLAKEGKTVLYFASDNVLIGLIAVADKIKKGSTEAIEQLKARNISVVMLTGDNAVTAEAIRDKLKIEKVISGVLPENKEQIVSELKKDGVAAMVGDGINDSPALMSADVGIAVKSGSDIAIDCADIVLMKNDIRDVVSAIDFSKRVIKNIKENLFWAFFYNTIGIPLAAGVLFPAFNILLNPMIASAAMSLSSIFVVTNALRLYKNK